MRPSPAARAAPARPALYSRIGGRGRTRHGAMGVLAGLAGGICLTFVSACAAHAPEMSAISHRLIVAALEAGAEERLSVFASISDGDGVADISRLFIVHDESELFWELTGLSWSIKEEGSRFFIGSNGLKAPPGAPFPRGSYRVIAYDLAGERAEGSFRLAAPDSADYEPPRLSLAGNGAVSVRSGYVLNTALFFDAGGNVTRTAPLKEGVTELDTLWEKGLWRSGADYLAVYSFDPKSEIGLLSWKIRLPD